MVKPKEKLGLYGLVAGSEGKISLLLKVAPDMVPRVRFPFRKWSKVYVFSKKYENCEISLAPLMTS